MKRLPNIHLAVFTYAGVEPDTMSCIVQELFQAASREIPVQLSHHSEDALISRSRSRALSALTRPESADVMVMVDRDIAWQIGDVVDLAFAAVEKDALVGGIYSYRHLSAGIASRFAGDDGTLTEVQIGGLKFHPATFLGTGLLAIPKSVVEKVLAHCTEPPEPPEMVVGKGPDGLRDAWREREALRISLCAPAQAGDKTFHDFFRPITIPHGRDATQPALYASEDWSFCWRAAKAGVPLWLWEKPVIRHWGRVPMTVPMPKKPIIEKP